MKKSIRVKRLFVYFCLIDVLLLPYFRPLHALISMPLAAVWLIRHARRLGRRADFFLLLAFALLGAASVARGHMIGASSLGADVTLLVPCVFSLIYFLFFKAELGRRRINIKRVLCLYIGAAALFSLVYWVSPAAYFALRTHWTLSGRAIAFESLLMNRFTFLMSDPNSISCVICSMLLYLFVCERLRLHEKLLLLGVAVLIVLSTLSTMGVLVLLGTAAVLGFWSLRARIQVRRRSASWYYLYFALVALALGAAYAFMQRHAAVLGAAVARYGVNLQSATLGGRTLKWREALAGVQPLDVLLIGKGSALNGFNAPVQPHNGHIHLILAYGALAYCAWMAVLFRKRRRVSWRRYACLAPLFLLFTLNTLVGDYRALLCLSLMAALAAQRRRARGRIVGRAKVVEDEGEGEGGTILSLSQRKNQRNLRLSP